MTFYLEIFHWGYLCYSQVCFFEIFPLFLTLWFRVQHIFSELVLAIKSSLALWSVVKLSFNKLLVFVSISAGGVLLKVEGSFGFCLRASWNGEKPGVFANEYFALYTVIMLNWYQCFVIQELCLTCSNNEVISIN